MQIKLSYKLFGAFFLILAIVVGAMILSRYIFSLSFKAYIHQVELEKLQSLVPALQAEYRTHSGWGGISADSQRWQRLLRIVPDKDAFGPPPPLPAEPPHGVKPPLGHEGPPLKDRPPGGPPEVLLIDARHRPIIGIPEPDDQAQLVAIEVEHHIVGWLGLHRHEPFKSGLPAVLLDRQARQLYLLGGVVIGLTALIAFLFSRHLLTPIHRLTRGTRELAERNFTVRIASTTGDELGQLAGNFNAMAHTLGNYENMRRQWLTDIAHELRTPLAVLRGEIEALQDGVRNPTPDNLASLHAEILRIGRLVEDLHLLSMADSDSLFLNKQWMSPSQVLKTTIETYQTRFAGREIKLDLQLDSIRDVRIKGDADRLGQVFTNILENACKYMHSPGILKISAYSDDQALNLYFQDSGPGVPAEALPRLFDRLYRVESSRNRDSGGSGLGLSICLHIIENHGGTIGAERSPMGGLFIGIRLPLTKLEKG
jgi:two-component system, OmpR family, sensor histidine kinase BaeS